MLGAAQPTTIRDAPTGPVVDVSSASSDAASSDDVAIIDSTSVPALTAEHHWPLDAVVVQSDEDSSDSGTHATVLLQTAARRTSRASGADPAAIGPAPHATCDVGATIPHTDLRKLLGRVPTPCHNAASSPVLPPLSPSGSRDHSPVENTDSARVDDAPSHVPSPLRLCLEECVAHPTFSPLHAATLETHASLEELLRLAFSFALDHFCVDFLHMPEVHTATKTLLVSLPVWDQHTRPCEVRLHVDGSFVERSLQAAWAVIATIKVQGAWHWGGWMSDRLHSPGSRRHCGQSESNAHTAEMVALLHALATAVTIPGVPCTIYYDSTSAGTIAAGTAVSHKQCLLAHAMINLHHIAQTLTSGLSFEHVRSHTGDPLNEAADTVAKAAAKRNICNNPHGEDFSTAVCSGALDWLWWTVTPQVHAGILPGLDDHGRTLATGTLAPCMHPLHSIPGVPTHAVDRGKPDVQGLWSLSTVTYNCTTLCKDCDRSSLAASFQKDAVHLAGLQETRTDPGPRSSVSGFTVFAAPADKGNFWCQLWVCTTQPVARTADSCDIYFDVAKAAFICSEPGLLVVVLPAGKQLFACIVGHAPIADGAVDVLDAW